MRAVRSSLEVVAGGREDLAGAVGGIGERGSQRGGADLHRQRRVRWEHVDEFGDGEVAVAEEESAVERLDDEFVGCGGRCVAELEVGESIRSDRGDIGDRAAGAGEVEVVDEDRGVRSVHAIEHGERLREVAHRHEGHELEAAADAVRGGEVAQLAEAVGELVVVDTT